MHIPGWWKRGVAVLGIAVVVGVLALLGDGAASEREPADSGAVTPLAAAESGAVRTVNVVIDTVRPEAFSDVIRVTGAAAALRDVTVAAEESGVIREVFVEKGARVAAGQPIAKIDDRLIRAQFDEAMANAALAQETYERQKRLWEEEQIGSEMTYLQAKYRAETAAASARVLGARLDRTLVRAPIAGILDARAIEVGSMVAPGAPIGRVIAVDRVKVQAGVPERFATDIDEGDVARISFDVLDDQDFEGEVGFVGSALNTENRTIPIEVVVPNPGLRIKPGMVATIALARRQVDSALVVPQPAVLRTENGYRLYVVRERNGRLVAEARAVQLGALQDGRVEILSGLRAGDRVITVGQAQVTDGDALNVIAPGPEALP
ncbi:MAG: efflux RND transporter periplasmic adaptor subunit [Longimicrobiales bacterium]